MRQEDADRFAAQTVSLKHGQQVCLRFLSSSDGEALGAFYASIPAEDQRFYCPHPLTRERALTNAAAAGDPNVVCLVVETEAHEIGGYAWYRWKDEASAVSSFGICVRRDLQGTGAGRALMARLLEVAREVGPATMSLTVQKANPRGVELYKKVGFQVVREQLRQSDLEPEYYMEMNVR